MIIRPVTPRTDPELAVVLLDLQRRAYAVEAALIGDDRISALHEDVDDVRSAALNWLAAFVDDEAVGAIGATMTADELDIDRLIVAPAMHRRGVGSGLVREVLNRAHGRRTVVSTGRDNHPARRLYERLGFTWTDDHEAVPGLWVSRYAAQPPT